MTGQASRQGPRVPLLGLRNTQVSHLDPGPATGALLLTVRTLPAAAWLWYSPELFVGLL